MGKVGSDKCFSNIMKPGKGNLLRARAQGVDSALHRRMAKDRFQTFADGRKDESMWTAFMTLPDHPPRDEYLLTPAGRDFLPVLIMIANWARAHHGEGQVTRLVDVE